MAKIFHVRDVAATIISNTTSLYTRSFTNMIFESIPASEMPIPDDADHVITQSGTHITSQTGERITTQ